MIRNDKHITGFSALELLDIKKEQKILYKVFEDIKYSIRWKSEIADLHSFRKALSHQCRVLHFSGHGVPGKILFENGKCEAQLISAEVLKKLIEAGTNAMKEHHRFALQIVFISACYSESVAEAFVAAGVPHVVAMQKEESVLDEYALEFTRGFYTALFCGHAVCDAFDIGETQADTVGVGRENSGYYKLLGNGDHGEKLFSQLEMGVPINISPKVPINDCDALTDFFVGRSVELHRTYTALVDGARMVSVVGDHGIGKTQTVIKCAQYAEVRFLFQRIYFIRMRKTEERDVVDIRQVHASSLQERDASVDKQMEFDVLEQFAICFDVDLNSLNATNDRSAKIDLIAKKVRTDCQEGNFLLVLDGCDPIAIIPQPPIGSMRSNYVSACTIFRNLLSELFRRVPALSVLLTSIAPVGSMDGVAERIINIGPLQPVEAAYLLTVRSPRRLKLGEMGTGHDLESLAKTPVLRQLGGHPKAISMLAPALQTHNLKSDEHLLLNETVPIILDRLQYQRHMEALSYDSWRIQNAGKSKSNSEKVISPLDPAIPISQAMISTQKSLMPMGTPTLQQTKSTPEMVQGAGKEHFLCELSLLAIADKVKLFVDDYDGCVVWAQGILSANRNGEKATPTTPIMFQHFRQSLCRYFSTVIQGDAISRPLSGHSLDFMERSNAIWGTKSVDSGRIGGPISITMFAHFWHWFSQLLVCIRHCGLWGYTNPRLLRGFLSKAECMELLLGSPAGTFLLRFSESKIQCIVIAYVKDQLVNIGSKGRIEFVQVPFVQDRGYELRVEGNLIYFPTLQQLLANIKSLRVLYPNIPKESVLSF